MKFDLTFFLVPRFISSCQSSLYEIKDYLDWCAPPYPPSNCSSIILFVDVHYFM
ncbi:hypothetical protein Lalb_Chr20g0113941 [Lupinus albus]|uniref:Uncharacterized protein n=1 Tax=Lupinus albus TaxID=3870 RepID=A0A6A4NP93_LUPAL|nr:hypothetical protein Lalb_Chr20g0113941 [Lupinus albus]